MIEVSQLFLTVLTALASLGAIFMFGLGIRALVGGRVTICADCLEGRAARFIGLVLTATLPALVVVLLLFGAPQGIDWRLSAERFVVPILAASIVIGGIIGTVCVRRAQLHS